MKSIVFMVVSCVAGFAVMVLAFERLLPDPFESAATAPRLLNGNGPEAVLPKGSILPIAPNPGVSTPDDRGHGFNAPPAPLEAFVGKEEGGKAQPSKPVHDSGNVDSHTSDDVAPLDDAEPPGSDSILSRQLDYDQLNRDLMAVAGALDRLNAKLLATYSSSESAAAPERH